MNKTVKCFQYYKQLINNCEEVFELKTCFVSLGDRLTADEIIAYQSQPKSNQLTADSVAAEEYFTSDEEFKYRSLSDTESYDSEDNGFHVIVHKYQALVHRIGVKVEDNCEALVDNMNTTKVVNKVKTRSTRSKTKSSESVKTKRKTKGRVGLKVETKCVPKPESEPKCEGNPELMANFEPKAESIPELMTAEDSLLADDFYTTNMELFFSQSMSQSTQSSALIQQSGRFSYYPSIGAEDKLWTKDESIRVKPNVDSLLKPLIDMSEETDCWPLLLKIIPEYMFALKKSSKYSILLAHKLLAHYDWSAERKGMEALELSQFRGVHNQIVITFMREILISCYSREDIIQVLCGTGVESNGWPFVSMLLTFLINQSIKKGEDFSMALIHFKLIVEVLVKDFQHFLGEANDYCTDIQQNNRPVVCQLIWSQRAPNYLNSVSKQLIFLVIKAVKIKNDLLLVECLKLFELCSECLRIGSGNVRPFVKFSYNQSTPITELFAQLRHQSLDCNEVFERLLNGLTISWIKLQFCAQIMSHFIIDLKNKYLNERQRHLSLKLIVECLTNAKLLANSSAKQPESQSIAESKPRRSTTCAESSRKRQSIGLVAKTKALTHKEWSKKNKYGENALHTACIRGQTDKLRQLLNLSVDGFGVDPNDTDNAGYTPLCEAAIHGHRDCIQALIEWKNKTNKRLDFNAGPEGQTALHDCIAINAIDCAKLILESGGLELLDNKRTSDGKTAKDLIVCDEMKAMIELLVNKRNSNTFRPKIDIKCSKDSLVFIRVLNELIISYIESTKIDRFIDNSQNVWTNIFSDLFNREMIDSDISALIEDLAVFRQLPKIVSNLKKLFDNSFNDSINDLEFVLSLMITSV